MKRNTGASRKSRLFFSHAIESLESRTLLASALGSSLTNPAKAPAFTPTVITGAWPTYTQAVSDLQGLAASFPSITKLVNIGTTVQGRTIYAMEITDNPGVNEDEPEFYYQGQIHGDEPIGMYNSFQLMNEMLTNYGGTSATAVRETNLINNMDLWFVPSMNWDGYNASVPGNGSHRGNANNIDLNRNFPEWTTRSFDTDTRYLGAYGNMYDGPAPQTALLQVETVATMNFLKSHHFVASANFHSGDLVVNYPWDTDSSAGANYAVAPDDLLFKQMALVYATQNTPMYNNNASPFVHGTTNGDNWYPISGGEQDWANIYTGDMHFTIELNGTKYPAASQLNTLWNNNRESMLQFMEASNWGLRGLITDANTGAPLNSKITVLSPISPTPDSHHPGTFPVYSDPTVGDYHRMLLPGTYQIKFEAAGYVSQTLSVTIAANSMNPTLTQRLNVQLLPPDLIAPSVQSSAFLASGSPQTISFSFSEQVQGVDSTDLLMHNNTSGANISAANIVLDNYDSTNHIATFRFTTAGNVLPSGYYTASLNGAGITDTSGNALSNGFARNLIYINGAGDNDSIYARRSGSNLLVWLNIDQASNPATYTAPFSTLANFNIDGFDGNDALTLDFSGGEVRPVGSGAFSYRLGSQSETLGIVGPMTWDYSTDPANDTDQPNLTLKLSGGATSTFSAAATHLAGLDVQGGALATLASGLGRLLVVGGLNIVGGTVDLNDNDMIVNYTGSSSLATVAGAIRTARNGGAWNGTGLSSTAARNESHGNTTLGAMEASDYKGIYGAGAKFDGETIGNECVVIKYTYFGDANFNGKVDGGDYARIDQHFGQQSSQGNIGGWINGDFDYNNKIDGGDYAIMDGVFATQGSVL